MGYWELYDIIEEILTDYWEKSVIWEIEAEKVIARNPTTDIKQDNTPMVRRIALQQYGLPTLNQIDVGLMTFSKELQVDDLMDNGVYPSFSESDLVGALRELKEEQE